MACNGSPMNIGLAPGKAFIASETSAFNRHTKNFIAMSDLGVPRSAGRSLDVEELGFFFDLEPRPSADASIHAGKTGKLASSSRRHVVRYSGGRNSRRISSWRQIGAPRALDGARDCGAAYAAIARALAYGGRLGEDLAFFWVGYDRRREDMDNIKHLLLVGCGTSMNASLYGAKLMRDLEPSRRRRSWTRLKWMLLTLPVKNGGVPGRRTVGRDEGCS